MREEVRGGEGRGGGGGWRRGEEKPIKRGRGEEREEDIREEYDNE